MDFDSLPQNMEFFAFDGQEGIALRTDYYHFAFQTDYIPGEYLNKAYEMKFTIGSAPPLGTMVLAQEAPPAGETIPEPASIALLFASFTIAVKHLARTRVRR
jgi:hypothetical protein